MNDYSQTSFPYTGIDAENNPQFKTIPFKHQSETIEWMIYREALSHENIRGGMVLLDMGLGKTYCALACVVLSGGTTLAIVPAQLVYVWESEINRHFNNLSYFTYHGPNRKKRFKSYLLDKGAPPTIMIMSYSSMASDINDNDGPLQNITFHRIIYDECQAIKNQHSRSFQACIRVSSTVKWFLSGTPIMNKIQEMYPYLRLLRYARLDRVAQTHAGRQPQTHINRRHYTEMQELLKFIAIRRTKDILQLPIKTFHDTMVTLDEKEREFYNTLRDYAKTLMYYLVRNWRRIQYSELSQEDRQKLRMIIFQSLLGLIFHLRIACCNPLLVIDKIPKIAHMTVDAAIKELKKPIDGYCPVCYNDFANVTCVTCSHSACASCWSKTEKLDIMRCFTCFGITTPQQLVERVRVVNEAVEKVYHDNRIFYRSSKTQAILDKIKAELELGNKIVVVSQWTTYLDKIIQQFKYEMGHVPFVLLTGKTLPIKRQKIVEEFQANPDIKVCFASLTSSSEGITLTAAHSMILCDVYWNKAKIEQMSDRIHRIGQQQNVNIYSIYVANSIEMKIKELIQKKDVICKVIVDCKPLNEYVDSWLTRMIHLVD